MATLKEYFNTDFSSLLKLTEDNIVQLKNEKITVELQLCVHLDFNAGAVFFSCYVPNNKEYFEIIFDILKNPEIVKKILDKVSIGSGFAKEKVVQSERLVFVKRYFIYSENNLTEEEQKILEEYSDENKIILTLRDKRYEKNKSELEKPLAFISHDSKDKKDVAEKLAIQLQTMLCPVWYDEYSLKVGDSLRESIEKGIKECKKCVLILTPNFLANSGWTKKEFDSIFTREILEKENFILPVWKGVTAKDVYEYSPSLADRVGINWDLGVEKVAQKLYSEIIK